MPCHLVLIDEENQARAVIACNPNEDITAKVELAIQEDLTDVIAESVSIVKEYTIEYNDIDIEVDVIVIEEEDGELLIYKYTLAKIALYK